MKFLDCASLESINLFLSDLSLGDSTIKGNLEAFSCKHAGMDKKLSISLEHEILEYLGKSVESDSSSPVEYLSSRSSRKTLIYLILTLSHMYPDYDFSAVQAHSFFREEEWDSFKQVFDTYMFEAARLPHCDMEVTDSNLETASLHLGEWADLEGGGSLLASITKAIDEVVKLGECEIYSYNPDFEGDPFLDRGAIWSFNFFFYNRKLKRVVSFRCCCISNMAEERFFLADEEGDDIFTDMDM